MEEDFTSSLLWLIGLKWSPCIILICNKYKGSKYHITVFPPSNLFKLGKAHKISRYLETLLGSPLSSCCNLPSLRDRSAKPVLLSALLLSWLYLEKFSFLPCCL